MNINQCMAPPKHSVTASHEDYAIIVFLSKCTLLVAVAGASPDTESCVELPAP